VFYGYVSEGVDPQTGYIIFKDADDSNSIDDADKMIIGDPNPDFTYGMINSFYYRNFSLSIFLQGVYGNDIFNATRLTMEAMEQVQNQSAATLDRWHNPGDITDIPRAEFGYANNSFISTRFVEDGSYLRVKSITLSYDFNPSWLKAKTPISNLNVFVSAQNLLTFTKYSGYDPEVTWYGNIARDWNEERDDAVSLGVDYGTYPNIRTFNFGLNVSF
jgi:hypothetical protein